MPSPSRVPEPASIYADVNGEVPIFVGRRAELVRLWELWENPSVESSVVKMANMPGIGKTALARHFFRAFGFRENALCIEINSKDLAVSMRSPNPEQAARNTFHYCVDEVLPQISWYYDHCLGDEVSVDQRATEKQLIEATVQELGATASPTFVTFLTGLFRRSPLRDKRILLFWDEIQTLYGKGQEIFLSNRNVQRALDWLQAHPGVAPTRQACGPLYETVVTYEQGAFRPASEVIAGFLKPRQRLVIVSGTQYRFLNALEDLGSPLRGRTVPMELNRLTVSEVREWLEREHALPEDPQSQGAREALQEQVTYWSGGIPRFVQMFLDALPQTPETFHQLLARLARDFEATLAEVLRVAGKSIDQYILGRVEILLSDYGNQPAQQLLARLARIALFHD